MATVPSIVTQVVGALASASWANSVKDGIDFLTGVGSNTRPIAVVKQSVSQSIPASTWTALTMDAEDLDSDGGHSNVTNTSRYTAQTAGWYLVVARYGWTTHASETRRIVALRKNGTGTSAPNQGRSDTRSEAGSNGAVTISAMVYLAAGDWIEALAYQDSGGALGSATTADLFCQLSVLWQRS